MQRENPFSILDYTILVSEVFVANVLIRLSPVSRKSDVNPRLIVAAAVGERPKNLPAEVRREDESECGSATAVVFETFDLFVDKAAKRR